MRLAIRKAHQEKDAVRGLLAFCRLYPTIATRVMSRVGTNGPIDVLYGDSELNMCSGKGVMDMLLVFIHSPISFSIHSQLCHHSSLVSLLTLTVALVLILDPSNLPLSTYFLSSGVVQLALPFDTPHASAAIALMAVLDADKRAGTVHVPDLSLLSYTCLPSVLKCVFQLK